MAAKLGGLARTYLTLLACVLFVSMPSGVLHLTLCDCNGILLESYADVCPCTRAAPAPCSDSCASVGDRGNGCCAAPDHDAAQFLTTGSRE